MCPFILSYIYFEWDITTTDKNTHQSFKIHSVVIIKYEGAVSEG